MTMRVELFGGPNDGETREVGHVVASLDFPAVTASIDAPNAPRVHRYEWRAQASPAGYYYAGLVRC